MKTAFTKFEQIVPLLKEGWEIYTRRGSAPYNPVYYYAEKNGCGSKRLHFKTVEKLISDGIINGTDSERNKYKLK